MHKNIPVSDTQKRGKRKTGETIKAFARFLMSVKKYRGWLILSVVLAVGSATLGIFIPKILGDMTNIAVDTYPNIDFGTIIGKVWLVVGLFVASAILNYAQAYILTVLTDCG